MLFRSVSQSRYGGKDKNNINDWDYNYNQYNYECNLKSNAYIYSSWGLNSIWGAINNVPSTLTFRFKTNSLPTSNIPYSQSLWSISGSSGQAAIILTYTGSGYTSGSYSGSIIDPYYQYAKLDFIPDITALNTSASVYLPFFNGEWWSVMLTSGSSFNLYAKNFIYNGHDNGQIGFQASSSIAGNNTIWTATNTSFFGSSSITNYRNFSGSFQEIRYYTVRISESIFDNYVMNPNSIEGNGINQGPNQLAFRASLGGELYTVIDEPTYNWNLYNSRSNAAGAIREIFITCIKARYDYLATNDENFIGTSIHPKITGSWSTTSSFLNGNNTFNITSGSSFIPNSQSVFFNQFLAGIKNPVSDKIKSGTILLPYSSSLTNIPDNKVLSSFNSIQQNYSISQSYTRDVNYVEVAFSPQNEINDDITSQIGFFNIGEYIGDPRLVSSSAQSYPDLDVLRNDYFQKYIQNYNYNDFIRLIKYFDNSLFKLIKDFVPARAGVSTGIVIKQHLLERNKYPVPQINYEDLLISGSTPLLYTITGSNAGSFPDLGGRISNTILPSNYNFAITQSWNKTNTGISGSVSFTQSTQEEFFNGELSGSNLIITDGDLNGDNPFLKVNTTVLAYTASYYNDNIVPAGNFLNINTSPNNGEIYLLYDDTTVPSIILPPGPIFNA